MSINLDDYFISVESINNFENDDIDGWIKKSKKPSRVEKKLKKLTEFGGSFTSNKYHAVATDFTEIPFMLKDGDQWKIQIGQARLINFSNAPCTDLNETCDEEKSRMSMDINQEIVYNVLCNDPNVSKKICKSKKRKHSENIHLVEEESFNSKNIVSKIKKSKLDFDITSTVNDVLNSSYHLENVNNAKMNCTDEIDNNELNITETIHSIVNDGEIVLNNNLTSEKKKKKKSRSMENESFNSENIIKESKLDIDITSTVNDVIDSPTNLKENDNNVKMNGTIEIENDKLNIKETIHSNANDVFKVEEIVLNNNLTNKKKKSHVTFVIEEKDNSSSNLIEIKEEIVTNDNVSIVDKEKTKKKKKRSQVIGDNLNSSPVVTEKTESTLVDDVISKSIEIIYSNNNEAGDLNEEGSQVTQLDSMKDESFSSKSELSEVKKSNRKKHRKRKNSKSSEHVETNI